MLVKLVWMSMGFFQRYHALTDYLRQEYKCWLFRETTVAITLLSRSIYDR